MSTAYNTHTEYVVLDLLEVGRGVPNEVLKALGKVHHHQTMYKATPNYYITLNVAFMQKQTVSFRCYVPLSQTYM